jgi:hypothetical protein
MIHPESSSRGHEERRRALVQSFSELDVIEKTGRGQELSVEDILDATVACWSARRLGRSLTALPS